MQTLRRVVLFLIAIVIVLVAVAYLLPQRVQVARSVDIAAPPSIVFPLVADLRQSDKWSPWLGIDPNIRIEFSGAEVGVGQVMRWTSSHPQVGIGSQTITAYEPDTRVATALDFGPQGRAIATTTVEPQGDGSRVTWGFETDLGMNPVSRYFGLAMEGMIAPDYERGLAKLKEVAEAEAAAAAVVPEPEPEPEPMAPASAAEPDASAMPEPTAPDEGMGDDAAAPDNSQTAEPVTP